MTNFQDSHSEKYEVLQQKQIGGQAKIMVVKDYRGNKYVRKEYFGAEDLNQVQKEREILERLDHPNIIKLRDIDEQNRMILDYIENQDLFDQVKEGKLSLEQKLSYCKQILDALVYLRQMGVAHRDLKLENILVDQDQTIKLIDFGFSDYYWNLEDRNNLNLTYRGSLSYQGPEVLDNPNNCELDVEKSEIFSLGVTLFSIMVELSPFFKNGSKEDRIFKVFINNNAKFWQFYQKNCRHNIPQEFRDLMGSMLHPDPSQRPSFEELLNFQFFQQMSQNQN